MTHLANGILVGDCRKVLRTLPADSAHMTCTSPPYWKLREYEDAPGQIGQEETSQEYVNTMVEVFREVYRVLRPDGVVFLNLGDTYNHSGGGASSGRTIVSAAANEARSRMARPELRQRADKNLGPKQLLGIPWRVALALQADGWVLRQEIIWHKRNPMRESVTDRCCRGHEHVFLLTKSTKYYFDSFAIREKSVSKPHAPGNKKWDKSRNDGDRLDKVWGDGFSSKTTVWDVPVVSYRGAHFATFPKKLVEPCVKAGTSAKGCCPECGAPWTRIIQGERVATRPGLDTKTAGKSAKVKGNRDPGRHVTEYKLLGWQPGCDHGLEPVPCTVLDPFFGAGTTGLVALRLGRRYLGVELSETYAKLARQRLSQSKIGFGLGV